jgi:CheY-like chemotaxis protein
MVLRAELGKRDRKVIAHTTAVTAESVVVRTDSAFALDDVIGVQLSLRGLLPPLALEARVVAKESGAGLGYFPGVTLAILPSSEDLGRLREVLDRTADAAGPSRILVVEDSALMRDFVHAGADRFSKTSGRLTVDTVDTAEGAIAKLADHAYDLALIDLYLGGATNGADLVRDLRARGSDLPMIGFSIGGPKARDAFLDAGADLFLDKPVMMKDLFATIGRLTHLREAP